MRCVRELGIALVLGAACREGSGPTDDGAGTDVATADDSGSGEGGEAGSTGDGPWASLEERPCPDDSEVTWESFGGGYVIGYCTTCHHSALPSDMRQLAPIAMNFESLELVRMHAARMWARAGDHNATMPPVGAPGDDERALFGEWLACGAPTNADLGME